MTVYARSDVMSVALSYAHGGCGEVHTRPVVNGAPAKYWALTCPQCEDHLRSDPLWASHESKIPETRDEQLAREELEKRSQVDSQAAQSLALDKISQALAGNQELMARFMEFLAVQNKGSSASDAPALPAAKESSPAPAAADEKSSPSRAKPTSPASRAKKDDA